MCTARLMSWAALDRGSRPPRRPPVAPTSTRLARWRGLAARLPAAPALPRRPLDGFLGWAPGGPLGGPLLPLLGSPAGGPLGRPPGRFLRRPLRGLLGRSLLGGLPGDLLRRFPDGLLHRLRGLRLGRGRGGWRRRSSRRRWSILDGQWIHPSRAGPAHLHVVKLGHFRPLRTEMRRKPAAGREARARQRGNQI